MLLILWRNKYLIYISNNKTCSQTNSKPTKNWSWKFQNESKLAMNAYRLEMCVQIIFLLVECRIGRDVVIEWWRLIATASSARRISRLRIIEWDMWRRLRHYRQCWRLWKPDKTHWRRWTSSAQIIFILQIDEHIEIRSSWTTLFQHNMWIGLVFDVVDLGDFDQISTCREII